MGKGIDCACDMTSYGQQLVSSGITFVVRYCAAYSSIPGKIMTYSEAKHLSQFIWLVSVFEGAGDHISYFTKSQGEQDAQTFMNWSSNVHQPKGTPCYFAVDTDTTIGQINSNIIPYFQALNDNVEGYEVDSYGDGAVNRILIAKGLVKKTWLAYAPGWQENRIHSGDNLTQSRAINLFGEDVDTDTSNGSAGGWKCL